MKERLIELLEKASAEAGKHFRETTKKVLAEKGRFNSAEDIDRRNIYEVEADYLIANGVIVPPCKVGDKVYVLELCNCTHHYGKFCGANKRRKNTKWLEIVKIPPTHYYTRCLKLFERPFKIEYLDKIGKRVFLTREEAEQKLKEKEDEGK